MNVSKKIIKKHGPAIVDLDLPVRDAVKGALEEVEKLRDEKTEKPGAKPTAEKTDQLSDAVGEKILSTFIEKYRTRRWVSYHDLIDAARSCGVSDPWRCVSPFLDQLKGSGEITETGRKTEHGAEIYEFTENGAAKYADRILEQGPHERLLANFIDLLRSGQRADAEAFAGASLDRPGEALAFLAHMLKVGEMEKTEKGEYKFTAAALDKRADQVFWCPAFKLMRNPFVTFEARIEQGRIVVKAPMIDRVQSLISARSSAIVEGERGAGKSMVIVYFKDKSENITTSISPRSVWRIKDAIRERVASKIGPDGKKITNLAEYGGLHTLTPQQHEVYKAAVDEVGRTGHLFDVPDNLLHKTTFEFADVCAGILDKGGFILLFATLEQARLLKRLDTFARFPVIKFERPRKEFFIELFLHRLATAWIEKSDENPLSDGAIDRIADAADYNPRRFIILCGHLITEMRERGVDKPIDEKMADELLKDKDVLAEAPIDVTEALQAIMRDFGSKGAGWVKLKVIRAALLERYGLDLRPETIGRRLTEMGYQRRYAPSAEYLASG